MTQMVGGFVSKHDIDDPAVVATPGPQPVGIGWADENQTALVQNLRFAIHPMARRTRFDQKHLVIVVVMGKPGCLWRQILSGEVKGFVRLHVGVD